jgi:hypothetical protein
VGDMQNIMDFNYPEKIGALNSKQRLYFYELFAYFLTVSMRGILFTEGIVESERIERAKWLNEIAHRITYKIFFMDNKPDLKWTDTEIQEMIQMNIKKHPATEADVNMAIEMSYNYIMDNESDSI